MNMIAAFPTSSPLNFPDSAHFRAVMLSPLRLILRVDMTNCRNPRKPSITLLHELRSVLLGDVTMYSDDILVVTLRKNLELDMRSTDKVCVDLMGPKSIEISKTETGRTITFIGFEIDLDRRLITISERNILRTLYGFLNINIAEPIKVKTLQKLASWVSRYSSICAYMKPFVSVLYAEYAGKGDHVSLRLSKRACRVISCFLVLLGLTAINSVRFARPIESYQLAEQDITIEFDASLTGVGLLYYKRSGTTEILLGGGAVDISMLNFKSNPAYQKTAEFMAAILGIRGLRQWVISTRSISLRGDSITALKWAGVRKVQRGTGRKRRNHIHTSGNTRKHVNQ